MESGIAFLFANTVLEAESVSRASEGVKMKSIPIAAAQEIAGKYGYDQIVVIGRAVGEGEHVTTYGKDKENCDAAAQIGDFLKFKIMGWQAPPANELLVKLAESFAEPIRSSILRKIGPLVASEGERVEQREMESVIREMNSLVQFASKREMESPSNHQEFAQEARDKLRRWDKIIARLVPTKGGADHE